MSDEIKIHGELLTKGQFTGQLFQRQRTNSFGNLHCSRQLVSEQVYSATDEICAISKFYQVYLKRAGYTVRIYAREGDTWKIRMDYAN